MKKLLGCKNVLESSIQKEGLQWLNDNRIVHYRMNTTGVPRVVGSKIVLTPSRQPGVADTICHVLQGPFYLVLADLKGVDSKIYSRTVYIEWKRSKGGRQSTAQKIFQRLVEKGGCEYYIVTSIEQLKIIFNKE